MEKQICLPNVHLLAFKSKHISNKHIYFCHIFSHTSISKDWPPTAAFLDGERIGSPAASVALNTNDPTLSTAIIHKAETSTCRLSIGLNINSFIQTIAAGRTWPEQPSRDAQNRPEKPHSGVNYHILLRNTSLSPKWGAFMVWGSRSLALVIN